MRHKHRLMMRFDAVCIAMNRCLTLLLSLSLALLRSLFASLFSRFVRQFVLAFESEFKLNCVYVCACDDLTWANMLQYTNKYTHKIKPNEVHEKKNVRTVNNWLLIKCTEPMSNASHAIITQWMNVPRMEIREKKREKNKQPKIYKDMFALANIGHIQLDNSFPFWLCFWLCFIPFHFTAWET